MKISNAFTIQLTLDEAIQLAKILQEDIYDDDIFRGFETRLKRELGKQLGIKTWDL